MGTRQMLEGNEYSLKEISIGRKRALDKPVDLQKLRPLCICSSISP
jgi:hypothetical protein